MNLSGGGAMIQTDAPLEMWQKVTLMLANATASTAPSVDQRRSCWPGIRAEKQIAGDHAKRDDLLVDVLKRNFPDMKKAPRKSEPAAIMAAQPSPPNSVVPLLATR